MFFQHFIILHLSLLWFHSTVFATDLIPRNNSNLSVIVTQGLGPRLSKKASFAFSTSAAPRWSEYGAADIGVVVNVATELDVLVTVSTLCFFYQKHSLGASSTHKIKVQYCIENKIGFFAQNGGHAWGTTFHLGLSDLLINLAGLRNITFNAAKTQAVVQGGALVKDVVNAAYANGAQIPTGNCNCVGTLGAILGGGFGRLMGFYGLGVDNLVTINLVTSYGTYLTVTPQAEPDLWWALRGAGPNFGIVTSVVMKSYPIPAAENGAWAGSLIFTPDKIEVLIDAINDLVLTPRMALFLYYAVSGGSPVVIVSVSFAGPNNADGAQAFSSIVAIGPVVQETAWVPFNIVNAAGDSFCVKGGYKPSFGVGLAKMVPSTWREIWNEFVAFIQINGTSNSTILAECYSMGQSRTLPDSSSSFPWRSTIKCNAAAIPWYYNTSLTPAALSFGHKVRNLWFQTSGTPGNET